MSPAVKLGGRGWVPRATTRKRIQRSRGGAASLFLSGLKGSFGLVNVTDRPVLVLTVLPTGVRGTPGGGTVATVGRGPVGGGAVVGGAVRRPRRRPALAGSEQDPALVALGPEHRVGDPLEVGRGGAEPRRAGQPQRARHARGGGQVDP